jgi:hypothetical protein
MFPSDAAMNKAKNEALNQAKKYRPSFDSEVSGAMLANLVLGDLILAPVEKLKVLRWFPTLSNLQSDLLFKHLQITKRSFAKLGSNPYGIKIIEHLKKNSTDKWPSPWLDSIYGSLQYDILNDCKSRYKSWLKTDSEIIKLATCAIAWLFCFQKDNQQSSKFFKDLTRFTDKAIIHGWKNELLQILNRLLEALPNKADNDQQHAILLSYQSAVLIRCERQEQALQSAQKALALISDPSVSPELYRAFEISSQKSSWALGMLNRWSEALDILQTTRPQLLEKDKAWNVGQAARYLWRLKGLTEAWRFIADQKLDKDMLSYCIGQLGDGVCDTQRVDGVPQAYAAGRQLLTSLIKQANKSAWKGKLSMESAVRHVFINMLDTGLDLPVLQDLARDLPNFAPKAEKLTLLAQTLYRWFGELRNREAVDKNALPPDPDWATTITALNEELSIYARIRLGLAETPRLSTEAAGVFVRVLAFIK